MILLAGIAQQEEGYIKSFIWSLFEVSGLTRNQESGNKPLWSRKWGWVEASFPPFFPNNQKLMLKVTTSDILSRLHFIIFFLYHSKAFLCFTYSLLPLLRLASCVG